MLALRLLDFLSMRLLIATANLAKGEGLTHALEGVYVDGGKRDRLIVKSSLQIVRLRQLGFAIPEPEEPGKTLLENALIKAHHYTLWSNLACVADDSGLFVNVLDGNPGAHSRRFFGEATPAQRRQKLLSLVGKAADRACYVETVLALTLPKSGITKVVQEADYEVHTFVGRQEGTLSWSESGESDFDYEAIFIPAGSKQTAAQARTAGESVATARTLAVAQLRTFLEGV